MPLPIQLPSMVGLNSLLAKASFAAGTSASCDGAELQATRKPRIAIDMSLMFEM
ncbi:MAG: hypothetical protein KJN89_09285 [Gammaproteobacteria bacterium]|nr:hypothetical protein [Gammaproteobacteria bacterium]NNJ50556.1 hypothetical protein [Gammaproteobacteria bacterium]